MKRRTHRKTAWAGLAALCLLAALLSLSSVSAQGIRPPATPSAQEGQPAAAPGSLTFAVIGDYGGASAGEAAVAQLVQSWQPAFVITAGDDYYKRAGGSGSTKYDNSTGRDYCAYLAGITTAGTYCPQPGPSPANRFFPIVGNDDYNDAGTTAGSPATYLDYFDLPGAGLANSSGNERYYDFMQGPVHFFMLNSNRQESDGTSRDSEQAQWLRVGLAASTARWNIVMVHHPPYSSGLVHGSTPYMQWPFARWGADAVISGHAHDYERIEPGDGAVYFVNGLGGASRYPFATPVRGSQVRYNRQWGAQRVTATGTALIFEFISTDGVVQDTFRLPASPPTPLHLAGLTGESQPDQQGWTARVTIGVQDAGGQAVVGAAVYGVWSAGAPLSRVCTTGADGLCTVSGAHLPVTQASVAFYVNSVVREGYLWMPADGAAMTTISQTGK